MFDFDWLQLCRRSVERHRRIFAEHPSIADRSRYDGVGRGGDHTLVIDRLCEDAVFDELEAVAAEGHSFLAISEERGEVSFGEGDGDGDGNGNGGGDGDSPVRVVIDPIDGSLNARRTMPSHSLSFAVAGGPAMSDVEFGYVYDFGAGEEYWARRGEGAWLDGAALGLPGGDALTDGDTGAAAGSGDRAEERGSDDGDAGRRAMEVVGLESADPGIAVPSIESLGPHVHRLRVIGSIAISVCAVAAGRLDGMLTLGNGRSVDIAAAYLIAEEAGKAVGLGRGSRVGAGLGLDERYPVAAAATPSQLEILLSAQELSPGLRT